MLWAQQESINDLKKMITLLLDKQKKKPKSLKIKASSSKSKSKEKEGENFTSEHSDGNENNFEYENPESSSEKSENSEAEDSHAKRMSELKKCLEPLQIDANFKKWGWSGYTWWSGMLLPTLQVQGTDSAHLQWQGVVEPTYILF